ncbi:inovirus Gp2 family protein [Acinetobacter lwoffii]|uniref:Inovirus Gp2 family protein n=2 Tax=Acinetobacter lwoffii TaxID=28090 RepID=A0AAJ4P2L4_ACILW|nr:inovirus Gp2 family protein [Acinetobacter lwoffii]
MSKSMNESKLTIQLEVITELWIKAENEPQDFYEEFAELLIQFDDTYHSDFQYFGYINAWCDWLDDHDIYDLDFDEIVEELKHKSFEDYRDYFNGYKSKQLTDLRRHRENEKRNLESLSNKMNRAVGRYSKSEVVRVDLAYLQSCHDVIDIKMFYQDLEELRKAIVKRKDPFHDLVDFAWALEQGETKGYHCHLLLIFNGHQRQKGWGIADKIGKLWKRITNNEGCYFNCHDPEQIAKYRELGILGIGRIHRDNPIEVRNLRNAGAYLVNPEKEAQHLRVKCKAKMRTFQ